MLVRFGYVAMSVIVQNASPSRTMTATYFKKQADREAAVRKLESLAKENLTTACVCSGITGRMTFSCFAFPPS